MPVNRLSPTTFMRTARGFLRNDQLLLALLALVVGLVAGWMVVGFREAILFFHAQFFNAPGERLYEAVAALPWWQILLVPTLGGLIVGVLVRYGMADRRPQGVADVIEARRCGADACP